MKRYVALKVAIASESESAGQELEIFTHLTAKSEKSGKYNHILTLLDSFQHHGPNGIHQCFVFEVMGPSVGSFVDDSLQRGDWPGNHPHELSNVKVILRQVLLGLDFMHKCGIAHSDLSPGNVLLATEDLDAIEESRVAQYDEKEAHFVKVLNDDSDEKFVRAVPHILSSEGTESGFKASSAKRQKMSDIEEKKDSVTNFDSPARKGPSDALVDENHHPRYLALTRPLRDVVDVAFPIKIKISDMGGAFFLTDPPEKPITPLGMRSPELILGRPITESQDIWSFCCLMFELIGGRMLFPISDFGFPELPTVPSETDDEVERDLDQDKDEADHKTVKGSETDAYTTEATNGKIEKDEDRDLNTDQDANPADFDNDFPDPVRLPDVEINADHLQQFACTLRPLPASILSQFPTSTQYFEPDGRAKTVKSEDGKEDILPWYSLEHLMESWKDLGLSGAEKVEIAELVRWILMYDPDERPSVEALLRHPWFQVGD